MRGKELQEKLMEVDKASAGAQISKSSPLQLSNLSNYYLKFRALLISDATKLLGNRFDAEEIVQEAFLYLLTSGSELETETDLIRFLRWKTRNLCLDRLRLIKQNSSQPIQFEPELIAPEESPVEMLERAEEAAIVSLALARLEERQRMVLLSTSLGERSLSEVSETLGLTDNASRQLLYRARKSFKVNLAAILSEKGFSLDTFIGGRAKKHLLSITTTTVAIIAALGLGAGYFNPSDGGNVLAAPGVESLTFVQEESLTRQRESDSVNDNLAKTPQPESNVTSREDFERENPEIGSPLVANLSTRGEAAAVTLGDREISQAIDSKEFGDFIAEKSEAELQLAALLDREFLDRLLEESNDLGQDFLLESNAGTLEISVAEDVRLAFGYTFIEKDLRIDFMWISINVEESEIAVIPQSISVLKLEQSAESLAFRVVASDLVAGDVSGNLDYAVGQDSLLSKNAVLLDLGFQDGNLELVEVRFTNRDVS